MSPPCLFLAGGRRLWRKDGRAFNWAHRKKKQVSSVHLLSQLQSSRTRDLRVILAMKMCNIDEDYFFPAYGVSMICGQLISNCDHEGKSFVTTITKEYPSSQPWPMPAQFCSIYTLVRMLFHLITRYLSLLDTLKAHTTWAQTERKGKKQNLAQIKMRIYVIYSGELSLLTEKIVAFGQILTFVCTSYSWVIDFNKDLNANKVGYTAN